LPIKRHQPNRKANVARLAQGNQPALPIGQRASVVNATAENVFSLLKRTTRKQAVTVRLPRGEQRAGQQDFGIPLKRLGKQRLENYNRIQQFGRQCLHRKHLFWRRSFPEAYAACRYIFKDLKMDNVEL